MLVNFYGETKPQKKIGLRAAKKSIRELPKWQECTVKQPKEILTSTLIYFEVSIHFGKPKYISQIFHPFQLFVYAWLRLRLKIMKENKIVL